MRGGTLVAAAAAAGVGLAGVSHYDDLEVKKFVGTHVTGGVCRKVVNSHDKTGLNLRLYQYQSCPFSCKVRVFLDYYGFSYEVVEVNPVTKSQLGFIKDYKKVPIVTSGESVMTESSLIISKLATYLRRPELKLQEIEELYPSIEIDRNGKKSHVYDLKYYVMRSANSEEELQQCREEREWRQWVDDHFIHLISPNVYRTPKEALETFIWFSKFGGWEENFSPWNRILATYLGAFMMYFIAKRLKARHKITDERQALADAFTEWMEAIGPDRKFLGGNEPNLADLAMYGAITSFSGCSAFKEVANKSRIMPWYTAMCHVVSTHEGRHMIEKRQEAVGQLLL